MVAEEPDAGCNQVAVECKLLHGAGDLGIHVDRAVLRSTGHRIGLAVLVVVGLDGVVVDHHIRLGFGCQSNWVCDRLVVDHSPSCEEEAVWHSHLYCAVDIGDAVAVAGIVAVGSHMACCYVPVTIMSIIVLGQRRFLLTVTALNIPLNPLPDPPGC